MWLKRLSAHPDLPVLYSSLGFSALWMLLTAKKGLHVDIGDFHACLYYYMRNFNLLPRAVVFQLNLKYLHVKITN